MANEEVLIGIILWGFLLGKFIPTNKDNWLKWWYNRRGVAYWIVTILEAGKVIHRGLVKQNKTSFTYDKGRYVTNCWNAAEGKHYSPTLDYFGEKIMFFNKNSTNPLEIQETRIIPSHNDPEKFQAIIEDTSIRQALGPEIDISTLKRFIFITMAILALAIAGIMFLLLQGA